jgi:hypothetical protein
MTLLLPMLLPKIPQGRSKAEGTTRVETPGKVARIPVVRGETPGKAVRIPGVRGETPGKAARIPGVRAVLRGKTLADRVATQVRAATSEPGLCPAIRMGSRSPPWVGRWEVQRSSPRRSMMTSTLFTW